MNNIRFSEFNKTFFYDFVLNKLGAAVCVRFLVQAAYIQMVQESFQLIFGEDHWSTEWYKCW